MDKPSDTEKVVRAVTRKHGLDPAKLSGLFSYTKTVAAIAAYVSISHDARNAWAVSGMIYHMVKDDAIRSDITQTAIRLGVAAAKNIYEPEQSPEFKNPVVIIKAGQWSMNQIAGGYVIHAGVGSRRHPSHVTFHIPKWLGDKLSRYKLGELLITPESCSISYSKTVKKVRELDPPRSKASIPELSSGVPYLHDACEPLMAADMNAYGAMVGTKDTVAKFDLAKQINRVLAAKKSTAPADRWRMMKDDMRYERRHGRKKTNRMVEAKRERQRVLYGGDKLHNKLGHRRRNARKARKNELAGISGRQGAATRRLKKTFVGSESDMKRQKEEIKAPYNAEKQAVREKYAGKERRLNERMSKCVTTKPRRERVDNKARQERASKASRSLDHAMHAAACTIVAWAMLAGCAIILEDLKGMPRGWIKFNKRTRTRLNASAMMKFQRLIYEKARWNGIEVLVMHPRNTSARCWMCRTRLSGDYHLRKCLRCMVCVDRDVNAVLNMLRTIAAARYGRVVRPSLDEARFLPDIMLDPGRVMREGGSLRVDGKFAGPG